MARPLGNEITGVDVLDAAARADGKLPILTRGDGNVVADAFDPSALEPEGELELRDTVEATDYDPTGTFLLATGTDGALGWYGAGRYGVLATGMISASW